MLKKVIVLVGLFCLGSLTAQTITKPVPKLYSNVNHLSKEQQNINILAVMVEFQPDEFELTYGDGTFGSIYSKDYGNNILDPLPHNKSYFEDHLTFASNYYRKVSNENVTIEFTVLPEIYTVSKPMRDYSPVEGESFRLLADFSEEVWTLVSAQSSNTDFSSYNTFVIFHAGAGKDISTSDLFGEARDLPSIYLGLNSFKEFYGSSFNGFQLNDGSLVDNTIILPETESREESVIGDVQLIELSINGLIVSSIASHLGLPDLFDAETGKSAIGRFGLMDGQSLFAFAGLFPPEPSAWEKIFLGWEDPKVINANTSNIIVTANEVASETDSKIIKIPINSSEYYLIENRTRDANKDGINLTYKVGGQVRNIKFSEDLDNFNNAFVDTMKGVVIDVDEYDWAIPGNGILIWHIDDKIINENYSANRINVGDSRGVDLEEADGIQDIGEEFQSIFGDIIIAEGDEFDFWYSSNSSQLYENQFGIDTKPSTKSNSGGNSLITFSNFSDIGNQMSFDVSFETNNLKLLNKISLSQDLSSFNVFNSKATPRSFGLVESDLIDLYPSPRLFVPGFADSNFITIQNDNNEYFIGVNGNNLNLVYVDGLPTIESVSFNGELTSNILIREKSLDEIEIFLGLSTGDVLEYNFNFETKAIPNLLNTFSFSTSSISQIASFNNELVATSEDKLFAFSNEFNLPAKIKKVVITEDQLNKIIIIVLTDDNSIYKLKQDELEFELIYESNIKISDISLADLKNDGDNYIVFNVSNRINAINLTGGIAEQFPVEINELDEFIGSPLISDIDSDGQSDIISISKNGEIYALSGKHGEVLKGFPLSLGAEFNGISIISKQNSDLLLSIATKQNEIFYWEINSTGSVEWSSKFANNYNSSSVSKANNVNFISDYFPKNKTYNWPNPVYGNSTFIRTYVSENSNVEVKVFDLAGGLVADFEFNATGGIESEFEWNVSQIQSGAYFARIEVKSENGKTESKIIKIAVVK